MMVTCIAGCKKKGCLDSSGAVTVQTRPVSSFHQVVVNDNVNIVFKQDTIESIRVEAGEKLQPFIKCDIENNTLTISNNTSCTWLRAPSEVITVYVSVKSIDNIILHGSGDISSENAITSQYLTIDAFEAVSMVKMAIQTFHVVLSIRYENAIYNITGTTNTCRIYCGQKGTMDARGLTINYLDMDYRSIFNSYVWVVVNLNAKVQYKGNVYYKATPQKIDYERYNDGQLLPL
jgi:hypothetical protein